MAANSRKKAPRKPSSSSNKRKKMESEDQASTASKKRVASRVFSLEDETAILQGMIDCRVSIATGELRTHLAGKLSHAFNETQIYEKIRRLKEKFVKHRMHPDSLKGHDAVVFELGNQIWAEGKVFNGSASNKKRNGTGLNNEKKRVGDDGIGSSNGTVSKKAKKDKEKVVDDGTPLSDKERIGDDGIDLSNGAVSKKGKKDKKKVVDNGTPLSEKERIGDDGIDASDDPVSKKAKKGKKKVDDVTPLSEIERIGDDGIDSTDGAVLKKAKKGKKKVDDGTPLSENERIGDDGIDSSNGDVTPLSLKERIGDVDSSSGAVSKKGKKDKKKVDDNGIGSTKGTVLINKDLQTNVAGDGEKGCEDSSEKNELLEMVEMLIKKYKVKAELARLDYEEMMQKK